MVALVTGAGRGLGRAIALELAAHRWDLALVSRTRSELEEVAREASSRYGVQTEVLPAAVDDPESVRTAFEAVDRRFERLDAVINSAGVGSFRPVAELDPAEWQRMIGVNLTGTFLCCREAVRRMLPRGQGQIINVLSIAAKIAQPNASAYCASKWGALALTKSLSEEVRRQGIRVTAFCPGSIDTPFWESIPHNLNTTDMLRPEEVAASVRFLLEQPASLHTDEMVVMPPKGLL